MNRKNTLMITVITIAVLAVMGILLYLQSLKTVKFDVKKSDLTIKIEPEKSNAEVGKFTGRSELRLQEGKYKAVVQNENYDNTPIVFEVKGNNTTQVIDPNYSSAYLAELLKPEQAAINKVISDAYPKVIDNFRVQNGQLYKDGQWYATLLLEKTPGRGVEPDIYRTVLKKENDKWVMKTKPALVLSAPNYPDIPFEILSSINSKDIY